MKEGCHFIGIGGIGMSGLAKILLKMKVKVSGSDTVQNALTAHLANNGAEVYLGQNAQNVKGDKTIVFSSGIAQDNPELLAAKALQCPLMHRSDLLLMLMKGFKTLSVAGTHGKTTTSSLLAWTLLEAGLRPSYAVGGVLPNTNTNAEHGEGEFFVAEVDESDGTLTKYLSYGAIITNMGKDHLDHYGTEQKLHATFKTFIDQVEHPEWLLWCSDDPILSSLTPPGLSYGFAPHSDCRASDIRQEGWGQLFDICLEGKMYKDIKISLCGDHNVLNATAVFVLTLKMGIEEEVIRKAFCTFHGVKRRCERLGEEGAVLVLDDYAHHPTEIRTTLRGIRRAIGERRLIAVYQPHRYTRIQACLGTFTNCFDSADEIIVTEIYSAGEKMLEGVTHEKIVDELPPHAEAITFNDLVPHLAEKVRPGDVVVTLGAGSITAIGGKLLDEIKSSGITKYKVGVVFGGKSLEHEISIKSSKYLLKNLNSDLFDIESLYVSQDGKLLDQVLRQMGQCDVLFPITHGPFGEDGTLQGLFEMLDKAYVGCDHRSAAIGMDKRLCKDLAMRYEIPTLPYEPITEYEWKMNPNAIIDRILERFNFPIYVKGVHLGSSLGVFRVESKESLSEGIKNAFKVDTYLIAEPGISAREIEFLVVGNDVVHVYPPGELCAKGEFCGYVGKYGQQAHPIEAPAKLPRDLLEKGCSVARQVYQSIGCQGWARIDFFLDASGTFWFNEVNPIPGLTETSGVPLILKGVGMDPKTFLAELIYLALQKHRTRGRKEVVSRC